MPEQFIAYFLLLTAISIFSRASATSIHHNVTLFERASHCQLAIAKGLRSHKLDELPAGSHKDVMGYVKDFWETHMDLPGYKSARKDGEKVMIVSSNAIARFRIVYRELKLQHTLFPHGFTGWPYNCHYFDDSELLTISAALANLIQTYDMDIPDFAEGIIDGEDTGTFLRAEHCLEIAIHARTLSFYTISIPFLEVALDNANDGTVDAAKVSDLLDEVILEHDRKLDLENPILTTEQAYLYARRLGPDRRVFPRQYRQRRVSQKHTIDPNFRMSRYWKLCRYGTMQTPAEQKNLFCRLDFSADEYFRINPLWVEDHCDVPRVLVVHNYLSEVRIQRAMSVVAEKAEIFRVNFTVDYLPDEPDTYNYLSRSFFLHGEYEEILPWFDMLTPLMAEQLKYAGADMSFNTYQAGDFAGLHADALLSVMLVLEEAEKGGNTIFPWGNLAVENEPGSAILWYHPPGQPPETALHAGCPVMAGRKTGAVMWYDDVSKKRKYVIP